MTTTTTVPERIELTATASTSTDDRTISGLVVPYNTISAHTSYPYPVRIAAGAIDTTRAPARVKLLIDHDRAQPVGVGASLDDNTDGLSATFTVPETTAGTQALLEARSGLRDGLSVGIAVTAGRWDVEDDTDIYTVTAATLNEVSLCALPAFDDARVTATREEHSTMPEAPTTPPAAALTEAPAAPPVAQAPPILAGAHHGITGLEAAARTVATLIADGAPASAINAALSDVVPADDAGAGFLRPNWIGELWTARRTDRPWIDSIDSKPLGTGTKVYGWRWVTRPQVADYAGNKTEIPSNAVSTEPVEAPVQRTAGGWDVDRIYVDLADEGMIRALLEAALEDYVVKTDAKVRAALVAAATTITGAAGLPGALSALGSAAAGIGSGIGFVALASDVWAGLTTLTKDEVPWWMGSGDSINLGTTSGTVGNMRIFTDPQLSAGQVVAGDKRAGTWYEKTPPVRVQAVDLPRGGVDLAVFGYHGTLINDARALFKTTVSAAPVE